MAVEFGSFMLHMDIIVSVLYLTPKGRIYFSQRFILLNNCMYTHTQHPHSSNNSNSSNTLSQEVGLFSVSQVFIPGKVLGFSAVKSPMTELKEAENQHPAEKQASTKGERTSFSHQTTLMFIAAKLA